MSEPVQNTESKPELNFDEIVVPDKSVVIRTVLRLCYIPATALFVLLGVGVYQGSLTTVLVTASCLVVSGTGAVLGTKSVLRQEVSVDHSRELIQFTQLARKRRGISVRAESQLAVLSDSICAGYRRGTRCGSALIVLLPNHIVTLQSGIWNLSEIERSIGGYFPEHSSERHWGDQHPLIMIVVLFFALFGTTTILAWLLYW